MLTPTIPRCVRGRIYQYNKVTPDGKSKYSLVGIFDKCVRWTHLCKHKFVVLAYDTCNEYKWQLRDSSSGPTVTKYLALDSTFGHNTLTEVSVEDLLLFVNYTGTTELFKQLLSDPYSVPGIKWRRRKRVSSILRPPSDLKVKYTRKSGTRNVIR